MDTDDMFKRAVVLGGDHAEADHLGKPVTRLYSGRDVAHALGLPKDLDVDTIVGLRESYEHGWSSYF